MEMIILFTVIFALYIILNDASLIRNSVPEIKKTLLKGFNFFFFFEFVDFGKCFSLFQLVIYLFFHTRIF